MKNLIITAIACTLMTGCAAISNDSSQTIFVETYNDNSKNTLCIASNEEGHWENIRANTPLAIHRDGNPLKVECKNAGQTGTGSLEPEFQTKYVVIDFILLDACIISCLIDGATNAFYKYPDTVTVPMKSK